MILFLITLAIVAAKPLNPKKVIYAVNCGAPSNYKGPSGIAYEKDIQTDSETVVADYSLNSEVSSQRIKFTREPDVYLTERHAYKTFSYQIPLQKEGTYTLILKFAEVLLTLMQMYFDTKGKRVFHIKFGEQRVIENLDVVAKVGKYASNDEYIEFEFLAGQVFHNGVMCVDAVKNGKLQLILEKTKFDNPYIHGLVLYAGAVSDTDYSDYQYMKANWEKVLLEEKQKEEVEKQKKSEQKVKRKERVKIRNDHLNEIENEFEVDDSLPVAPPTPSQKLSLRNLITSPLGTGTLWIFLIVGLSIFRKVFSAIDNVPVSGVEQTEPIKKVQKEVKQKSKK